MSLSFTFYQPTRLSIDNEIDDVLDRRISIKSLSIYSKDKGNEFRLINIRNNYIARFFYHDNDPDEIKKYAKLKGNLAYYAEYGFAFNDHTYISFKSVSNVIVYPEKHSFEVASSLLSGDRFISYNEMMQDNTNAQWLWNYLKNNFDKLFRVDIEFFML